MRMSRTVYQHSLPSQTSRSVALMRAACSASACVMGVPASRLYGTGRWCLLRERRDGFLRRDVGVLAERAPQVEQGVLDFLCGEHAAILRLTDLHREHGLEL